jgi:Thermolysin metallopeptidase, alpha-helical domain/Thermolysin metallopeptidase, catalytic domain
MTTQQEHATPRNGSAVVSCEEKEEDVEVDVACPSSARYLCGTSCAPAVKSMRSLGLNFNQTIKDFALRTTCNDGGSSDGGSSWNFPPKQPQQSVPVSEFDYVPETKSFRPKSAGASLVNVNTAYNGQRALPITPGGLLISNIYFGGKKIQIAVYDAENADETAFMLKYFSNKFTISRFIAKVNKGGFKVAKSTDAPSANAFFCILSYYGMLFNLLGRSGLTGSSHAIVSMVNVRMTNAFWTGFCMCFGNGAGIGGPPGASALTAADVCGHELTHGLQTFSTEFEYQGESGALNESIADVFGVFLEFYISCAVDRPDWTIGEQFNFIIRNMEDPKKCGQPTLYRGTYWVNPSELQNDSGGVHTNSGVTNYMCYLVAKGSKNFVREDGVRFGKLTPLPNLSLREYMSVIASILFKRELSSKATLKQFAESLVRNISNHYGKDAGLYVHLCASAVGLLQRPTFKIEVTDPSAEEEEEGPPCCDPGDMTTVPPPSDYDDGSSKTDYIPKSDDDPFPTPGGGEENRDEENPIPTTTPPFESLAFTRVVVSFSFYGYEVRNIPRVVAAGKTLSILFHKFAFESAIVHCPCAFRFWFNAETETQDANWTYVVNSTSQLSKADPALESGEERVCVRFSIPEGSPEFRLVVSNALYPDSIRGICARIF